MSPKERDRIVRELDVEAFIRHLRQNGRWSAENPPSMRTLLLAMHKARIQLDHIDEGLRVQSAKTLVANNILLPPPYVLDGDRLRKRSPGGFIN